MLIETRITNSGLVEYDKVKVAIERLKSFEPEDGYYLAFSGGKDSVVIKKLADMAGVKYEAHYHLTSIDPPELVQFIKTFSDIVIDLPEDPMWKIIVNHGIGPTRRIRFCCGELKESFGKGRITVTGVRWAESVNRKKNRHLVDIGDMKAGIVLNNDNDESRRIVEQCYRTSQTLVNPIIDWSDDEVWEFIRKYNIPYCKLYDDGWKRLGCIGCPMAGYEQRKREFERWPTYKRAYIRAFDQMIAQRKQKGLPCDRMFTDGETYFSWWMEEITFYNPDGKQITLDDLEDQEDVWD